MFIACPQDVDGITVFLGAKGAIGLFHCKGMTYHFVNEKIYCFWSEFRVAKLSENSNFGFFEMRLGYLGGEHSASLQRS